MEGIYNPIAAVENQAAYLRPTRRMLTEATTPLMMAMFIAVSQIGVPVDDDTGISNQIML
ncbi:MAG: hypothetical protein JXA89_01530 [Anaerolineae bacterium]|nr:hypothetical protein [Anaerolineae bacterium]